MHRRLLDSDISLIDRKVYVVTRITLVLYDRPDAFPSTSLYQATFLHYLLTKACGQILTSVLICKSEIVGNSRSRGAATCISSPHRWIYSCQPSLLLNASSYRIKIKYKPSKHIQQFIDRKLTGKPSHQAPIIV